jgi:hypothetical protein
VKKKAEIRKINVDIYAKKAYLTNVGGRSPKTETKTQAPETKIMKYATQSTAPEWFQSEASKIYKSATSGTSPFNEWYEFDDRADALKLIAKAFDSQSFTDRFCWFDGDIYDYDQFTPESLETADDIDSYVLKDDAEVAGLGEIIEAESRF